MRAPTIATLLLLLPLCGPVVGFDWPVSGRTLISTFASSGDRTFRPDIVIGRAGEEVRPVADGELVFAHREGRPTSVPRAAGTILAFQHEGGVQSVYGHLDEVPELRYARGDTVIGVVGDTGAAAGPRLSLVIVDALERRFLNPIKLDQPPLQSPPGAQGAAPAIEEVRLDLGRGEAVRLADGLEVQPGQAEVLVTTYQSLMHSTYSVRTTPYRITLFQDGRIVARLTFDALREREGRLEVSGSGLTHQELKRGPRTYSLGEISLIEGQTALQVRVEGYTEDVSTVEFVLLVEGP